MKQTLSAKLHNRFDIEIRNANTGVLKQRAYAENIILNQAWAQVLANNSGWFTNIIIGTGTGTIEPTRTTLFAQLVSRSATTPIWDGNTEENWYSLRKKIVLLENEFIGASIREVGVGYGDTLCTHALLKDMNGNPVTIVKTDTDIITVYATIYARVPAWSKNLGICITRNNPGESPLICNILGQAAAHTNPGVNVDAVLLYPSQLAVSDSDCIYPVINTGYQYLGAMTVTRDYVNKRLVLYARVPAANSNFGGIKSYLILSVGSSYYQGTVPALICHEGIDTLTQDPVVEQIGVGNDVDTLFATAFPFISNATIKVDGIVVSPTVLTSLPNKKDIKGLVYQLGETGNGRMGRSDYRLSADVIRTNYFPYSTHTDPLIIENPFYVSYGIDTIVATSTKISVSDDMTTWTQVYIGTGTYAVETENKQKRYWKFEKESTALWRIQSINVNAFDALKNVIFASAPATGAIITAEYTTAVAAKDINHVVDITVTIQLGEYTPE